MPSLEEDKERRRSLVVIVSVTAFELIVYMACFGVRERSWMHASCACDTFCALACTMFGLFTGGFTAANARARAFQQHPQPYVHDNNLNICTSARLPSFN